MCACIYVWECVFNKFLFLFGWYKYWHLSCIYLYGVYGCVHPIDAAAVVVERHSANNVASGAWDRDRQLVVGSSIGWSQTLGVQRTTRRVNDEVIQIYE